MIRRIALLSTLLAVPFVAHAQTAGACTSGTLNGTYSLSLTGRMVGSTLVLAKTYEAVGTITFDGTSAVSATVVSNTNSASGAPQTLSGTYTIPSNCVGTLNFTTGDTASYSLIPYNSGKDYTIVGEDATYELTGSGGPQPTTCLISTVSGSYAFSGTGYTLSVGAIAGVNDISGLLQFDGAGGITGSWTVATNIGSAMDTVTGHYTSGAGCTGSATVTDPTGVGYTLNYVVTTADGSNIALIGSTSTNMFTATGHSTMTNPGLAVANAAGISGGTPPGSLFSIYGTGLSTGTAQPTSTTYPLTLGGASVTVNGESAPLSYASPTQINAEMPLDITGGVATVVVKVGTTTSNAVAATVPLTAVPGIFVSGANRAIAQNYPSYVTNSPTTPAPAGSVVIVYFTGGGPVQGGSVLQTGHAAPNQAFAVTESVSATVAGVAATVDYAGLTPGFIGLYQANIVVPKIGAGDHNVVITIGGTASPAALLSTS
ncbi:MAG TPA: hypothetical protein VK752_06880 [Bryobacteraceae bacterium]|jgi:uncharacterized protein (TIGR03437 family)|nr:hypothetical protein [Bryobacteraceae bacterium]